MHMATNHNLGKKLNSRKPVDYIKFFFILYDNFFSFSLLQ